MDKILMFLKACFLFLIYRAEILDEKNPWGNVTFKIHPRYFNYYIFVVIILPFVFVIAGVLECRKAFKKPKVERSTSYNFDKSEKVSKFNALKKF